MNHKGKPIFLALSLLIQPLSMLAKSFVYIKNFSASPIRLSQLKKSDNATEMIASNGTTIEPYAYGKKNNMLVFKLSRGAGNSDDISSGSIEVGIQDKKTKEYDWVNLFTMQQKVEHRFFHSNVFARLKTRSFDSDFKEGDPNNPIHTIIKVAGKQFVVVLKKIDIKNGDDDYVYMILDYSPNAPKPLSKETKTPQV